MMASHFSYAQSFEQVIARYNIGGSQITLNGDTWGVEQYVTTTSGNTWTVSGVAIENTDQDTLYQSERFGDFSYEIPVSQSGLYQVKLYFAEVHHGVAIPGGVGDRVFDVDIEGGQGQLTNYDIVAQSGASARAIVETFDVEVTDGFVSIGFTTDVDNAKLSALEVFALNNPAKLTGTPNLLIYADSSNSMTVSATDQENNPITLSATGLPSFASFTDLGNGNATLSASPATADAGEYTIAISAWDSIGAVDQQNLTIWVVDPNALDIIKLNAAGPQIVYGGETWLSDQYGNPGDTKQFYTVTIGNTENDSIYQSERHGDFTYEIPVPQPGLYEVRLHFAELWHGIQNNLGVEARVFNVDVEGQDQLSNYDIIQEAGASALATVEVLSANVDDGFLTISFTSVVNEAKISAIEVFGHFGPLVASPNITLFVQDSINYTITSSDPDGDPVALSASNLPGFVSFMDNGNGTGTLTIDPEVGDKGNHQITISATDTDGFTTQGTMTIYVRDQNQVDVIRLNAGGPTLTLDGTQWQSDQYGNPGNTWEKYSVAVDGTEIDSIYQSERNGDFTYEIPVPEPGLYQVNLHLAELWFGVSTEDPIGKRVFSVDIENGQQTLTNYDIVAEAGMPALATVEVFEVMVVDSFLTINFDPVVENPKISAIEVFGNYAPVVGAPNLSIEEGDSTAIPITATDSDNDSISLSVVGLPSFATLTDNGDGTGTITVSPGTGTATSYPMTVTALDADGLSSTSDFTLWVNKTTQDVALINTGGPQVTYNSRTWSAEQYYSAGKTYKNDTLSILGTENDSIYRTERYQTHSYAIPVDSGFYQLRLHFAELWHGIQNTSGIGARVFDVDIEGGQGTLDDYDIIKETGGPAIATVEQFEVEVNDGNLTIDFTTLVDNAKISAIEVVEVDTSGTNQGLIADVTEYQALVDLYNATNGANWTNNSNWLNHTSLDSIDTWHGITVANGDITEIILNSRNLTGTVPASLGSLKGLKRLELESNSLSGSLPAGLVGLTALTHFKVARNQITGSIPKFLGSLTNLIQLSLWDNHFTGVIPDALGNLDNLEWLFIGGSGTPDRTSAITGPIPSSLGNLSNVIQLWIFKSNVNGEVPASLGQLSSLEFLLLHENSLTGDLPSELGNLTSLKQFAVGRDELNPGPVPAFVRNLTNLEKLWMYEVNLNDTIPDWIGELNKLTLLGLWDNDLAGPIPGSIGDIGTLNNLSLNNNNLSASVPSALQSLSQLTKFHVQENSLSGDIGWLAGLNNLVSVSIGDNQFTGFPDFSSHSNPGGIDVFVYDNYLSQEDIESNFTGIDTHHFKSFDYGSQSNPEIDTVQVSTGQVVPKTTTNGKLG